MTSKKQIQELIERAFDAQKKSYSPYSGFATGAALLTAGGQIFSGCNIENAAYSPTMCAERNAIFKAVSEGIKDFVVIAVVGGYPDRPTDYCAPCGVCRQVMREFCDPDHFQIILAKSRDDYQTFLLKELLPESFGPHNLRNQ